MAAASDLPAITQEIVVRDGEPVWRLCLGGTCVEDRSGTAAQARLRDMAAEAGLTITADGRHCAPIAGPDPDGRWGEPGT